VDRVNLAFAPGCRIVLDTGAVIALAHGEIRARYVATQAARLALPVIVPAVIIAQLIRGGPADAGINRALKIADELIPVTPLLARQASVLLGRTRTTDVVDALVAAEALRILPSMLLTSDPGDLRLLLQADPAHPRVQLVPV
jgi:hypothetical protein